jgi:hypothetical protein
VRDIEGLTGTEWIHQRVVELVKQKAKEEMAQLEVELMCVIQAMEDASLSDNMAVAVAQVRPPTKQSKMCMPCLCKVFFHSSGCEHPSERKSLF